MNNKQAIEKLNKLKKELTKFRSKKAPALAAEVAVRMFKENFQREAFFGSHWKEVQRRKKYIMRNGKKVKTYVKDADLRYRPILDQMGDLERSVKKRLPGRGKAIIYSDLKYSRAHNEGLQAGFGRGRFKMPKRQFIGGHKRLNDAVLKVINKGLNDVLRKYK
jgi:phage gpG-like protein